MKLSRVLMVAGGRKIKLCLEEGDEWFLAWGISFASGGTKRLSCCLFLRL